MTPTDDVMELATRRSIQADSAIRNCVKNFDEMLRLCSIQAEKDYFAQSMNEAGLYIYVTAISFVCWCAAVEPREALPRGTHVI